MDVASCLICLLLVGQPPRSESPVEPEREAAGPLVNVNTPKARLTPDKLLTDGMTQPEREPLAGRPITLLEALSRTVGRARQLEVIRSYWRVALSVAEYNFSRDEF